MFILRTFGWLFFSAALMSFIEHQVHRQLMHRRNFLSERSDKYKRVYEAHAITHHGHYSKIFSDEPVPDGEDKEIRLTVRKAPIKALPFAALIALFSRQGALTFIGVVTFHHWAWNKIHLEMHKPEDRGFSRWPIYKFLKRYHWMHHKYPDKNFNVVFPFADYILGTRAKPSAANIKLMHQQLEEPAVVPHAQPSVVSQAQPVEVPQTQPVEVAQAQPVVVPQSQPVVVTQA